MQEHAALKILERGYKLILTDRDINCVCARYADEFVSEDTFDIKSNLEFAKVLATKYKIAAILTVAADCHETVAHLGKALGLSVIDPEVSRICRYKVKTRDILSKAGIFQPEFKLVKSLDQARKFARTVGKVAIKATNNSGSRGFAVVNNPDELTKELFQNAVDAGTTGYVIVEELMEPIKGEIAEQSVETLWYDGNMYWLNCVDRLFRKDFLLFKGIKLDIYANDVAWGVELGHINPAIHEYCINRQVYELVYNAGTAIGMNSQSGGHILKADVMLTHNGPCILEFTPRLSGGWDSSKSTPSRGADFIDGVISLALGEKLDLNMWMKYFQYKNPNLFSSVLACIGKDARDCIGRVFAEGTSFDREESLKKAYSNLMEGNYVVPVEQPQKVTDVASIRQR